MGIVKVPEGRLHVQILHQHIQQLRAAGRVVELMQQRRHLRRADGLQYLRDDLRVCFLWYVSLSSRFSCQVALGTEKIGSRIISILKSATPETCHPFRMELQKIPEPSAQPRLRSASRTACSRSRPSWKGGVQGKTPTFPPASAP